MTTTFDPYHQWLGIPQAEQPPNHYRLLGVTLFETDSDVIANAADQRMAHLRIFQSGRHSKVSQQLLNEVATARVTLLDAEKKAAYDARLQAEQQQQHGTGAKAAGKPGPRQKDGPPSRRPPSAPRAHAPAARKPPPAPTVELDLQLRELGEYRLTEKLGEGGMGTVYKAEHTKLGREVAVKVLTTARLGSETAVARFEREMLAVGRLDHPNIVRAYDAREIEGTRFLVMELVDGLDLAEVLRHAGPLPVADACEVIRQAALGLQCAHENQLVHRDIKPGNLMVSSSGQVKILDLGLARFEAGRPGEEMTGTGTTLGTLDYMAPEQASGGHHIDIRADIYSLGCTLYKLLAGRAPFDQPRYAGLMDKVVAHAKHSPPAIARVRGDIPKEVAAILNRMMAKDPARRFPTPGEVADVVGPFCVGANLVGLLARARKAPPQAAPSRALENTQGRLSSSLTQFLHAITPGRREAAPPGSRPNGNRWVLGAAAGIAVLLLAAALGWALRSPTQDPAAASSAAEAPSPERGALVVKLSEEQRASTELVVNNGRVRLPDAAPWEISSQPGEYRVRLLREGYEPYEETVRIGPGEKVSLEPEWVPQAALVLEWPVAEREGARLHVDGNSVRLPTGPDASDELHVPARPGTRQVWAERRGYAPFRAMVELGRGDRPRVAVEWEPAAGPMEEELTAGPGGEPPPTSELEPEPTPQPEREPETELEPEPEPAPSGPRPEELAALQALEAAETQWREATRASAEKAAAWDFTGAAAALAEVRFADAASAERLARRKDALTRMAALKARMIARINEADPPLTKADLKLRGFAGELSGADAQAITATLATGREESLPWSDLGTQAPGKLLQLVVESGKADDWLSSGVFALSIGDVELAERLLARAGQMGVDIGPYRGPLAQAAFDAARALLDAGEFTEAAEALAAMERAHAGTPWLSSCQTAVAAARAAAEQGVREAEAEKLYAEAVGFFENEQLFDLRPLVEQLKTDYAGTRAVTDDARKPPFAELEESVDDLGQMFTVRQDGQGDFKSIQEAIDAAPPNSLIEIQDNGPYNEKIEIPQSKVGLVVRGRKDSWPTITSAGPHTNFFALVNIASSDVTLEHLVLAHAGGFGSHNTCIEQRRGAQGFRMRRCVVYNLGHALTLGSTPHITDCVIVGTKRWGAEARVNDTFWLTDVDLDHGAKVDNVVMRGCAIQSRSEVRNSTIAGRVACHGDQNVFVNCIMESVSEERPGTEIQNCNVYGKPPFLDQAKPGKDCFSAPPVFVAPKNFDYRLVPGSPGTGKASDGSDVGVRYTPEMIEMLKLALELRARGIIKF